MKYFLRGVVLHMKNNLEIEPKGKALFTGSSDAVVDDLMDHMPDNFRVEKCPVNELKFIHALERFRPHVLVAVLTEEMEDTLKISRILEDNAHFYDLPVLAVGSQDSCALLQKNVSQMKIELIERPLNRGQFMERMCDFAAEGIANDMEVEKAQKESAKKASPAKVVSETPIPDTGRKCILVVDDDVLMLNAIKMYLQDMYDVAVVPSGKLALKFLMKKTADLVLLDYMMPEEDGPTVLKRIREETPRPDVPVLFLTGVNDKEMVMRCLELRPHGYLLKPVTRDALLDRVTEIVLGL